MTIGYFQNMVKINDLFYLFSKYGYTQQRQKMHFFIAHSQNHRDLKYINAGKQNERILKI